MRTLEEALKKFDLVAGTSGDGVNTACETSLLNWIDGADSWSDSLECASPLIRWLMISHNDAPETTADQRVAAVRLGMAGAIDTWWIPAEVVLSYYGDYERGDIPTRHERLVKMLEGVAAWKENKVRRDLNGADLTGADLTEADLTGADLTGANLTGADLTGADLTGANLAGANLYRAKLYRADLTGANNLGDARNLKYAVGEPASLPDGWEYRNGLIVKKS